MSSPITKQARGIATRERLVEATLDVIHEHGLAAVTTKKIAERAGTSRGALMYHFPDRHAIIEAAISVSLDDVTAQLRKASQEIDESQGGIVGLIEALWSIFNQRFMFVAMEHIVEARTNSELREYLLPSVQRFHAAIDEMWDSISKTSKYPLSDARSILNLSLCLIRGMQLQTIYLKDDAYYDNLLATWKNILKHELDHRIERSDGRFRRASSSRSNHKAGTETND